LEQAITQEEYADRWITSDLGKSLRSYQQALSLYTTALSLDPSLTDAAYNRLRLLFHVYETYKSVPECSLRGCEACSVHRFGLEGLLKEYQCAGWINWECGYNQMLIHMEVMEQEGVTIEEIIRLTLETLALIQRILSTQMNELDAFLKRLEGGETDNNTREEAEGEGLMYEQVVPGTILDTLIASWRFIFTALESCDTADELRLVNENTAQLRDDLDQCFDLLLRFDPSNEDPYSLNFKDSEVLELSHIKICAESMLILDFEKLVSNWSNYENTTSSRWLAQSDIYTNLMSLNEFTDEQKWAIVSATLQCLKGAQEVLSRELEEQRREKSAEVSTFFSKIVEVLITRADNELLRASLDCDFAHQHRNTLKINSINLLKSGLNYSQGNVGLRESALDRLHREKLKREIVIRLLIVTKDAVTIEDLQRNLGDFWEGELEELKKNSLYGDLSSLKGL
jgi:hypothetical protein